MSQFGFFVVVVVVESDGMTLNDYVLIGALRHISFSKSSGHKSQQYMLAATELEMAFFDCDTLKILKSFKPFNEHFVYIRQIGFLPTNTGQVFGHFSDDTIAIWTNYDRPKRIRPLQKRHQYLERTAPIEMDLNHAADVTDEYTLQTTNRSNGRLVCVTFSSDASIMCVTSSDGYLMTFNNSPDGKWRLDKVFRTKDGLIVRQCMFVSPTPPYDYVICVTAGSDCTLLSLQKPSLNMIVQTSLIKTMVLSSNSRMLATTLSDGECLVFSLPEIVDDFQTKLRDVPGEVALPKYPEHLPSMKGSRQMLKLRFRRMLSVNNEYPLKYRPIIWELLMDLPQNANAFGVLVKKGLHTCTLEFEQRFPLPNDSEMQKLKCIYSFLVNWCKVRCRQAGALVDGQTYTIFSCFLFAYTAIQCVRLFCRIFISIRSSRWPNIATAMLRVGCHTGTESFAIVV